MHYYERIRELRQDKDKTQTEIAEYLQIDQSYYSKYERGKHPIPIEILTSLCNYYGVANKCLETKQCFATFATKKPFI